MSLSLKRKAPDDDDSSICLSSPRNSVPCGDPRCDIPRCLKGPFTILYFYPPFSKAEIVAELDKPGRTIAPLVWNVYCPDNYIYLHQHRHLLHMLLGEKVKPSDNRPLFHLYMPAIAAWKLFDPLLDVIEVRFPGFLIMKDRDLPEENCQAVDKFTRILRYTVEEFLYK